MNESKNLLLSIHFDSNELNLAAGYVLNNRVHILGLNRYNLDGISKGNISCSETFERTLLKALEDFYSTDIIISDKCRDYKKHNLEVKPETNRLIIENIYFNTFGNLVTIDTIKNILKSKISGKATFKSCTSDIAATSLLIINNKSLANTKYSININIGKYSTSMNFISNHENNENSYPSPTIQVGFYHIVNKLNQRIRALVAEKTNREFIDFTVEEILAFLNKEPHFLVPRLPGSLKLRIYQYRIRQEDLENTLVLELQKLFHNCYEQFVTLDNKNYRFDNDFLSNTSINLMGYGADNINIAKVAALIFSIRYKLDRNNNEEYKNSTRRELIHSSSKAKSSYKFNLYSNKILDSLKSKVQYCNNDNKILFSYYSLTPSYEKDITIEHFCKRLDQNSPEYFARNNTLIPYTSTYTEYGNQVKIRLETFTSTLGLMYNFGSQLKVEKHSLLSKILKSFKLQK